jgi:hypothetical protein
MKKVRVVAVQRIIDAEGQIKQRAAGDSRSDGMKWAFCKYSSRGKVRARLVEGVATGVTATTL